MKNSYQYQRQLETAINAIEIHSLTSYSWFGKHYSVLPSDYSKKTNLETSKKYLSAALQSQLYSEFYCKGQAIDTNELKQSVATSYLSAFVDQLAQANSGSGYLENDWEVTAISADHIIAYKDGLYLSVPNSKLARQPLNFTKMGASLSLQFPKESLHISPGFYVAMSNQAFTNSSQETVVRIYFHLNPLGAIKFMEKVTSILNANNLPFSLKVVNDPNLFNRCDAVVLYFDKNDYRRVSDELEGIYPDLVEYLTSGTPAFTKTIASGIGIAEDPGNGESFGMNRCKILSEGLIEAYVLNQKTKEDYLVVVKNRFKESGIRLGAPYLNLGSTDVYFFNPRHNDVQGKVASGKKFSETISKEALLSSANEIGKYLVRTAIWHNNYCTWLGSSPTPEKQIVYSALGPDLYSGTSGIALFLGELYRLTNSRSFKTTSLGSINHALSYADAINPSRRRGFYSGWIGIAVVATYVAKIFKEKDIMHKMRLLLNRLRSEDNVKNEFDVMDGSSGGICGLLILNNLLNDESLVDLAIEYGDELLSTAARSKIGFSWSSLGESNFKNLTGFSHGTSGTGYALLELFRSTKRATYLEGAREAFNYERNWFDKEANNWPDFRKVQDKKIKQRKYSKQFMTAWCHGAPGIALSRIRAYEILKDNLYKKEADCGIQTTEKNVEQSLNSGIENFSLCHGAIGNAEILFQYNKLVGSNTEGSKSINEVAHAGVTYSDLALSSTSKYSIKDDPGLMLGLAGMGHFYLRLIEPAIPSVLLLRPECFIV